jgi:hypothetical protein
MRGETAANQTMKAVTKAKRRVTLSLSGLGFLDETEVADIPAEAKKNPTPEPTYSDGKKLAPHEIAMPDKPRASDWIEFGELLITAVSGAENDAEARTWKAANRSRLEVMSEKDFPYPKIAQRLEQALLTMGPKNAP